MDRKAAEKFNILSFRYLDRALQGESFGGKTVNVVSSGDSGGTYEFLITY